MNRKSRHEFLVNSMVAVSSLTILGLLESVEVYGKEKVTIDLPKGESPVSESDATASALGFHHDANKTDFTRYPARKKASSKNEYCKHCLQYNKLNEGWGKCNVVNNGVVSSLGWCGAWTKKAV